MQKLVKAALTDTDLKRRFNLTSANSINLARWLPQCVYYFYAWSRLPRPTKVVFSVPSGNFGNLAAGILAQQMGLCVQSWVAATNKNDIVPQYLRSGVFRPRISIPTISNAMDVGNPSNFSRVLYFHKSSFSEVTGKITGYAFSDDQTRAAISQVFHRNSYRLDPHSAVAYLGLLTYLQKQSHTVGVFLATAHPAKFYDVVEHATGVAVPLPESLAALPDKPVETQLCEPRLADLKEMLLH